MLVFVLLLWLFLDYCMFSYSEYIFSITVLLLVSGIVTHMLILPHESSAVGNSTAQTADGDFIVRASGFPSAILRSRVAIPRAESNSHN
jgi:hypothetical protein